MTSEIDPGNAESLRLALAGEIALGLISGEEAARELARDPLLAIEVSRWQERLADIALAAPPSLPDPQVLKRLMVTVAEEAAAEAASLPTSSSPVPARVVPRSKSWMMGLWQSVMFWRAMTGAGFAAAAAAIMVLLLPPAIPARIDDAASANLARNGQVLLVSQILPRDGPPEYVATFDAARGRLIVVPAATLPSRAGIPFLWLVPNDDADPIALGPLDPLKTVNLDLAGPALSLANQQAGLVITLEPAAAPPEGSARGPVLAHGKFSSH